MLSLAMLRPAPVLKHEGWLPYMSQRSLLRACKCRWLQLSAQAGDLSRRAPELVEVQSEGGRATVSKVQRLRNEKGGGGGGSSSSPSIAIQSCLWQTCSWKKSLTPLSLGFPMIQVLSGSAGHVMRIQLAIQYVWLTIKLFSESKSKVVSTTDPSRFKR